MGVTRRARQRHRFAESVAHFARRVRVGAEGDGHFLLRGQVQQGAAGINFAAILAQAGGVEFDGDVGLVLTASRNRR